MSIYRENPTDKLALRMRQPIAGIIFEACERRLVLSAQLMFDVLGDQALELHADLGISRQLDAVPIESHLSEAHAATGWNQVQQQFGLTGKGQTVAVIDSGIAWDHVALGGGFGPGYRVVGGWDFTEENDALPYDDGPLGFHGTHVSGIIGSSDPNHRGVAPDVDLVALRVFNDVGQGQMTWVERALQWVHENRDSFENPLTTVNLSLGTSWNANAIPDWAMLEEELQTLFNDGIVVTASAGNSFQIYHAPGLSYPAASPYVLPVSSVDDDGLLSDFSQRNSHVIAGPGRNIVSTVPDHVLGRDGKIDDFTGASGTSMAAPYVAGASVLVRQAMDMVGYADINLTSIAAHLHATADSVFDTQTGANYDRLNLERAIETLLPDDNVGNTAQSAAQLNSMNHRLDGWINTLDDQDVYRITAATSGTLQLDADSGWLDSLQWKLQTTSGEQLGTGGLDKSLIRLEAGQTYNLFVQANREIGSFSFDLNFVPADVGAENGGSSGGATSGGTFSPGGNFTQLGPVEYLEQSVLAGSRVRVQATHDGLFTAQWTNHDAAFGNLNVAKGPGSSASDAIWENGVLRVDLVVTAGQWLDIELPGGGGDRGDLVLANVLSKTGSQLTLHGTLGSDDIAIDLQNGLNLRFGEVDYAFANGTIDRLQIDAQGGNDSLAVLGSKISDKVDLRPTGSLIENSSLSIAIAATEQVTYASGGGADRVYLYDSDTDDTLIARPGSAELVGVGYRFTVEQVDRIYIHANGGGQDFAYLYDSAGDDRLSVRPQFSSMSGPGFFNYVSGFERVYAYANAGGVDTADLYDSAGNDRFSTSGASASIVGAGFSSFTRSFEQVNAYARSGGSDLATLYGSGQQTQWQQGSDFIGFREAGLSREARGFSDVESFVAGQAQRLNSQVYDSPVITNVEFATVSAPSDSLAGGLSTAAVSGWQPEENIEPLEPDDQLETLSNPLGQRFFPEMQVLIGSRDSSHWLSDRFLLPEEALMNDPDLELMLLDQLFSQL